MSRQFLMDGILVQPSKGLTVQARPYPESKLKLEEAGECESISDCSTERG